MKHDVTLVLLIATGFVLAWMAGCDHPSSSGTHAHGEPPPTERAQHDHDDHEPHTDADEVTLTAEAVAHYGVTVGPAEARVLRPTFVAPARVGFNAEAMAHVGSPLRGRVVDVRARAGDSVHKDDVLFVVESPELGEGQAALLQHRTAAASAAAPVELSRLAWDRARALFEQSQGISLAEVQRREAEYRSALAAQRTAESGALTAENHLHLMGMSREAVAALVATGEVVPRSVVRAPIDGQVVQRDVTLGELVGPERDALVVLADTSTFWVLVDVPEARLTEVAVGTPAWITAGAVSGTHAAAIQGRVALIGPFVDAATRTVSVRVEVPAGTPILRPGMFAQVELSVSSPGGPEPAATLAVPEVAVQAVEGDPAVFVPVPDEPNTFAKRVVKIGQSVGGMVPVFSGLVEGEMVVTGGTFILKAELGKGSADHGH